MPGKKIVLCLLCVVGMCLVSLAYSQTETEPSKKEAAISVVGRLALEKRGEAERLILHAQNAETYIIIGELSGQLKDPLVNLGENNLVSVTGKLGGKTIACEQSYKYEYNNKGEKELKTSSVCTPYRDLQVTQILFAKKSDEQIPPPKRDIDEERRLMKTSAATGLMPTVTGEIYGRIAAVNLKSPVKTIEISNRDTSSPLKKITLVLSLDTRIVKKIGDKEPMAFTFGALKVGQEVSAIYFRDELKSEALFITITRE